MQYADFSHLILYAKGWYKREDVLDDVKRILAHRCGLDPDRMSNDDVWRLCVEALNQHATPNDVVNVLSELFHPLYDEGIGFIWFDPNCTLVRAIRRILLVLQGLAIFTDGKTLIQLEEPNEAILPLKSFDTIEKYRKLVNNA
jgi:hypothetical protein